MNDEIIHLLMYLQNMIDSGQHKLFYNDLMHDEKVIDIINAITNLQEENEDLKDRLKVMEHFKNSLLEENERLSVELNQNMIERNNYLSRCEKAIEFIKDEAGYDEEIRSCCCDLLYSDCDKLIELLGGDE